MQNQLAIDDLCHREQSFKVGETLTIYQAARLSVLDHPYEKVLVIGEQHTWQNRLKNMEQFLQPCEGDAKSLIRWDVYCELLERISEGSLKLASCAFFENRTVDPIRATIRTEDFYCFIRNRLGDSPLKEWLEKSSEFPKAEQSAPTVVPTADVSPIAKAKKYTPGPAAIDDSDLIKRTQILMPNFAGKKMPAAKKALDEMMAAPDAKMPGQSEGAILKRICRKIK